MRICIETVEYRELLPPLMDQSDYLKPRTVNLVSLEWSVKNRVESRGGGLWLLITTLQIREIHNFESCLSTSITDEDVAKMTATIRKRLECIVVLFQTCL